jgi:hypothetical protein
MRAHLLRGGALSACVLLSSCLRPPDPSTVTSEAGGSSESAGGQASSKSVPSEAYDWRSVVIQGGGFVTGLVYSQVEKGLLYARTDVGGAYRYDPKGKSWIPITDFFGLKDSGYMGIESFAADPVKADRVYMAAGMYTQDWAGAGAFLRSEDRGATWKVFPVPFKMGGNELSRSDGERLAVDPNQPKVLYFGSRRNGLWKSEDEAQTWTKVDGFPAADDKEKGLGLVFVHFDPASGKKGSETRGIYIGSQVDGKIYHSADAGKTWQAIPNQPNTGFLPRRAALDKDGVLYVTYALGDSPYALKDGAVYRYEPNTKEWTDITPLKPSKDDAFGYGGVSVDRSHPGTLVVTTMDRWTKGAEIFRSTDRGKTWKPALSTAVLGDGGVKHVYHHRAELSAPQWLGDIQIDPFDANQAMIVEGGGVWATTDLKAVDSDQKSYWSFHSKNLEETVSRRLISPPEGAPLLSAQLDTCGFRHDKLDESPALGTFKDPMCASSDDIDFAGKKPAVIVRVGTYPWDDTRAPRGGVSRDGGATWKQFGSEPQGSAGRGSVALSADGTTIVWAPREGAVSYSTDAGKTWKKCAGVPDAVKAPDWAPHYLGLASDRVNPKKFYAYDALTGTIFVSTDGGVTFEVTSKSQRAVPEYELQYASIKAAPDNEGDVWITNKEKIRRSTDSGKSFQTIAGAEEGHGIGFGRPAPGKKFPAVYLAGTVSGVTGIYRSDDEGKHFVRINDDNHQYGGSTVVTGDLRVYGRVFIASGGRGILVGEPQGK